MTVKPFHQQALVPVLGVDYALRACLPTCFFMLGRASGYLAHKPFKDFGLELDWQHSYQPGAGWIRAHLSQNMRDQYHLSVVSWKLAVASTDPVAMKAAGYITSQREQRWYNTHAAEMSVEQIVRGGTPVIVTMRPGFGANTSAHAIILVSWDEKGVEIIDPDARNERTHYSPFEISAAMSPVGAASVVLPKL